MVIIFLVYCILRGITYTPPQGHDGIGTTSRQSHLHGIAFPILPRAVEALQAIARNELVYVQLVSIHMYTYAVHC